MGVSETNSITDRLLKRRTIILEGEIISSKIIGIAQKILLLQMQSSEDVNPIIDSAEVSTHATLKLCDIIGKLITTLIH